MQINDFFLDWTNQRSYFDKGRWAEGALLPEQMTRMNNGFFGRIKANQRGNNFWASFASLSCQKSAADLSHIIRAQSGRFNKQ